MANRNTDSETRDKEKMFLVGSKQDLQERGFIKSTIDDKEVLVLENEDEFYAILNNCPHQGGPIGEGYIMGRFELQEKGTDITDLCYDKNVPILSCPWHGYEFNLKDGYHRSDPKYRLQMYDIIVENDDIYIYI